jgi:segregation and condensation protein A
MEYTVKLEVFEGPLDLLLHLIKKNEIDIYDIPMALITQQYLEYLGWMRTLNLDVASEYLLMAATLVHIKSRMILPVSADPGDAEECEEPEDPRAELVRRLLEYQSYKEAAQQLSRRDILERDVFSHPAERPVSDEDGEELIPLGEGGLFALVEAFRRIMATRQWDEHGLEVDLERVSLADRIGEISGALEGRPGGLGLEELVPVGCSRLDFVVTFLALLEMVRLRMVRVFQATAYGTIRIVQVGAEDGVAEVQQ